MAETSPPETTISVSANIEMLLMAALPRMGLRFSFFWSKLLWSMIEFEISSFHFVQGHHPVLKALD